VTIFEQEALQSLADSYIEQFKDAIKNKPIKRKSVANPEGFEAVANASGRLADSPRVEMTENSMDIYVLAYIDEIVYGKPPGGKVEKLEIEKWLEAKGLNYSASAIVNNIKDFGNSIFLEHQGGNSGVLDDINIDLKLEEVKRKLITKKITDIKYANSII
jgi:hypothetical protein